MALIKCPECGKENVSDSAETCPSCGFGIKSFYIQKRKKELDKKIYDTKLRSVQKPTAPQFKYVDLFLTTIPGVLGFIIGPITGVIATALFFSLGFFCAYDDYKKEVKKYNLAQQDFGRYQREIVREQEEEARKETAKPKCPNCMSTNIEKISTTSRVVSVATVGLASKKIGKQYKCNNCKHMW